MENCKLPFVENDPLAIEAALSVVVGAYHCQLIISTYIPISNMLVDSRNFPILLHSNKGKHRVGILVGAMRKLLQK